MILDFIVGVAASIVASIICGLLTKKVFGKSNDALTSIYTIYIAFSAFVFVIILAFMLSGNLQNAFASWSGQNAFTVLRYVSSFFWILFVNVTIVTIIFIIVRQMELTQKSMDKARKGMMDYYNSLNKEDDNK